jgi:hypothetical protein
VSEDSNHATPAAGEEAGMHLHRPKPIHGAREIATEIAVIVIGIVIALVGEQTVEAIHWSHKVEEAEGAMRIELSRDDGVQAFTRAAISRCLDGQLQAVIAAVESGEDRSAVARLAEAYQPPFRSWDRQSWDIVVASDVGSHVGAERLNRWSKPFELMPLLTTLTTKEADGVDQLTGGSDAKGALTAAETDRILGAAKSLRRVNSQMNSVSLLLLKWLGPLDAEPSAADRDIILAHARQRYGACVAIPDPSAVQRGPIAWDR